nr:unnamed protein product [Callosobruchus analis]
MICHFFVCFRFTVYQHQETLEPFLWHEVNDWCADVELHSIKCALIRSPPPSPSAPSSPSPDPRDVRSTDNYILRFGYPKLQPMRDETGKLKITSACISRILTSEIFLIAQMFDDDFSVLA